MNSLLVIFLNEPVFISLCTIKWFQVFPFIACIQLNAFKYFYLLLAHS